MDWDKMKIDKTTRMSVIILTISLILTASIVAYFSIIEPRTACEVLAYINFRTNKENNSIHLTLENKLRVDVTI
jgi:hypothetical protein